MLLLGSCNPANWTENPTSDHLLIERFIHKLVNCSYSKLPTANLATKPKSRGGGWGGGLNLPPFKISHL